MKPNRHHPRRSPGFTLVEMLVVITIIGVLSAMLLPAIWVAVVRAREARIKLEIGTMRDKIEEYKGQYGDYPPDFTPVIQSNSNADWMASIAGRHGKKVARRIYLGPTQPQAGRITQNLKAIWWTDFHSGATAPGDPALNSSNGNLYDSIDAAEALVIALSGLSSNIEQPYTGAGGPMDRDPNDVRSKNPNNDFSPLFEFDETRLRDFDEDGFLEYYPPYDIPVPYVYLESRTYTTTSAVYPPGPNHRLYTDMVLPQNDAARPYMKDDPDNPNAANPNQDPRTWSFAAQPGFQIICAGLDGEFGLYPSPGSIAPTDAKSWVSGINYTRQDHDNIVNFNEARTLGADLP